MPDRIERLVIIDSVPLLPGYRWHALARRWRRAVIGEMLMGFTFRWNGKKVADRARREPLERRSLGRDLHPTSITEPSARSCACTAPHRRTSSRARARTWVRSTRPRLVLWGDRDPYMPPSFADAYAEALGGEPTVRVVEDAGHWLWDDEPAVIDEVAGFLAG